eukprot:766939-Hanusia_phi.AAC.5
MLSDKTERETYNFRQAREDQEGVEMPRKISAREERLDEFLSKPLDEFMQPRPLDREPKDGETRYEPWRRDGSDSPDYSDEENDVQKQSSERISALQARASMLDQELRQLSQRDAAPRNSAFYSAYKEQESSEDDDAPAPRNPITKPAVQQSAAMVGRRRLCRRRIDSRGQAAENMMKNWDSEDESDDYDDYIDTLTRGNKQQQQQQQHVISEDLIITRSTSTSLTPLDLHIARNDAEKAQQHTDLSVHPRGTDDKDGEEGLGPSGLLDPAREFQGADCTGTHEAGMGERGRGGGGGKEKELED